MRAWSLAFLVTLASGLSGCGYNSLTRQDEDVKAAWSNVTNQYQRRADLIPNLVRTVKGYATQEQQVLIGVTEARAKAAGSIQLTPELLNNPEAFARFQTAQNELGSSLKRLIAVAEAYPDLKSNENFRDLQSQLEGTENRITVARQRYIDAVRGFNTTVRSFPTNLTAKMFDFQAKPNFTVANEQAIAAPPTVDFGDSPAPSGAGSPSGAGVPSGAGSPSRVGAPSGAAPAPPK
jgi:LemA protein